MTVERLWELVHSFKSNCQLLGWKTSEHEDWVHAENQYHNFLLIRTIYPSSFKKVMKASKCAIRNGTSYRVVNIAYIAWLFSDPPPEEVKKVVMIDQNLGKNTAIYDLSGLYSGNPTCLKLNLTESRVFKEFEDFLQKKYGVKFKSAQGMLTAEV
jgi:hypothetical protein